MPKDNTSSEPIENKPKESIVEPESPEPIVYLSENIIESTEPENNTDLFQNPKTKQVKSFFHKIREYAAMLL